MSKDNRNISSLQRQQASFASGRGRRAGSGLALAGGRMNKKNSWPVASYRARFWAIEKANMASYQQPMSAEAKIMK